MNNAAKTDHTEHPLMHAYLCDLDCTLQSTTSDETTMIRQSVDEHLVSESTADKSGGTPEIVAREALDKLGPVGAITTGLAGEDTSAVEPVVDKSCILFISALTVVSALSVPFGVGFSMLLSVLAIVLAAKLNSNRVWGILLTVNVATLAIVLVHLTLASMIAETLMETVYSSGGF